MGWVLEKAFEGGVETIGSIRACMPAHHALAHHALAPTALPSVTMSLTHLPAVHSLSYSFALPAPWLCVVHLRFRTSPCTLLLACRTPSPTPARASGSITFTLPHHSLATSLLAPCPPHPSLSCPG